MFGTSAMSQTYFTFTPMAGLQRCFAVYQNGDRPSLFKNNSGNNYFHVGFLLDYHRNRFSYSLGYTQNNAGYAYKIKPDEINPLDSVVSWSYSHSSATPTNAIQIKAAYALADINLFRRKNEMPVIQPSAISYKGNQHVINFRLMLTAGMLYEHLQKTVSMNYPFMNSHVITQSSYTRLTNNGITGTLGFTVQFLHRGKESLALNFFYNHGFTRFRQIDITYTLINDHVTYHTTLISKASSFGMSLSYPIRIWDVDKRKAKKKSAK